MAIRAKKTAVDMFVRLGLGLGLGLVAEGTSGEDQSEKKIQSLKEVESVM